MESAVKTYNYPNYGRFVDRADVREALQKGVPPEGYMTSEEFRRRVKEDLKQMYIEHGLL
jgi:hypothetical protein